MNSYKTPLNDIRFALFDVLGADKRYPALGFEHADRDMLDAALDEAARFCEQVLAPLNQSGDEIGCVFDSAGFQKSLRRICQRRLGWHQRTRRHGRDESAAVFRRCYERDDRFSQLELGQLSPALARRD